MLNFKDTGLSELEIYFHENVLLTDINIYNFLILNFTITGE